MRRRPALPALTVAAAVLTACSSPARSHAPVFDGIRAVDSDELYSTVATPRGMRVREYHDRGLVGPHYTLGLSWVAVGRELDPATARYLRVAPVRAPAGKELVLVAVSPRATNATYEPSKPVPVVLLVNGQATPLPGLPLRDNGNAPARTAELIEVTVPPGTPLTLKATDAGQDQEIDLRSGAIGGRQFQRRDSKAEWKGESSSTFPFVGVPATHTFSVGNPTSLSHADHPVLLNYDGRRWAPPRKLFLLVPVPEIDRSGLESMPYAVVFDDSTAFSFTPRGGRTVAAKAAKRRRSLSVHLPLHDTVPKAVFQVPDTVTGGTVRFDLRRSHLADGNGATVSWITPPHVFTLKVGFSG